PALPPPAPAQPARSLAAAEPRGGAPEPSAAEGRAEPSGAFGAAVPGGGSAAAYLKSLDLYVSRRRMGSSRKRQPTTLMAPSSSSLPSTSRNGESFTTSRLRW